MVIVYNNHDIYGPNALWLQQLSQQQLKIIFTLNLVLDGPVPLQELDPNSKQYWLRVRKLAMRRNNLLNKLKRFQAYLCNRYLDIIQRQ